MCSDRSMEVMTFWEIMKVSATNRPTNLSTDGRTEVSIFQQSTQKYVQIKEQNVHTYIQTNTAQTKNTFHSKLFDAMGFGHQSLICKKRRMTQILFAKKANLGF